MCKNNGYFEIENFQNSKLQLCRKQYEKIKKEPAGPAVQQSTC